MENCHSNQCAVSLWYFHKTSISNFSFIKNNINGIIYNCKWVEVINFVSHNVGFIVLSWRKSLQIQFLCVVNSSYHPSNYMWLDSQHIKQYSWVLIALSSLHSCEIPKTKTGLWHGPSTQRSHHLCCLQLPHLASYLARDTYFLVMYYHL